MNLDSKIKKYRKIFTFAESKSNDKLRVSILEVLDPSYGMYVWPSAPVLAQFVWKNRAQLNGKCVLEIGAGTALPGIVAGLLGSKVILSDGGNHPQCRTNCEETCSENGLRDVQIVSITWGQFDHTLTTLPHVDVILGSDCFYDEKDFEDIVVTVAYLLEQNPGAEFWCTYQERSSDRCIEYLLLRWGLVCERILLESFEADGPSVAGSNYPGDHTIHMYIIRTRHKNSSRTSVSKET